MPNANGLRSSYLGSNQLPIKKGLGRYGNKSSNNRHGPGLLNVSTTCNTILFCLIFFLGHHHVNAALYQKDPVILNQSSEISQKKDIPDTSFRLPKEVKPLSYDLLLHPSLEEGNFTGRVSILISIEKERKFISLHQKELNISSASLSQQGHAEHIEIKESHPDNENEVFIVTPQKDLGVGIYNLTLVFSGSLQNKIVGFYSSKYKNEQNETRVVAASKFEPTHARRAFPCFDEPGFKAEFIIKLVHPNADCYNALSNMNIESTIVDEPAQGLTTVTFAKSVPMSTYLACFIISDYVAVTKNATGLNGKTFPVSIYTPRAKIEKGSFALDIGVKIVEYYIDLFQIDYPLQKLDMAPIPNFISGAMENWGMVTFREKRLLRDNKTTSTADTEDIVRIIAHELAHMWFGNLVTMAWWNDIWLNEGFATYMKFKSSNAILPEWNFMDNFALHALHPALAADADLSSRPIIKKANNPLEIAAMFNVISYQKGASILRMLENFVGSDHFYAAVHEYLKKFSYGNAETVDLFNIIQKTHGSKINISAVMGTWTRQMGFPVVNVMKHNFTYTLTQKRFLMDPDVGYNASESEFGYKWTIPITYITSENPNPTLVWFDKDAKNVVIKLNETVDWIKFNADQVGYYRVNYERADWETLSNVLQKNHKRFTTQDRTHILEDTFSLVKAEELEYQVAMNMTSYLGSEKHFAPWFVAANKLKGIDKLLSSTYTSSKYRDYVREIVNVSVHDLTRKIDELEHDQLNLRSTILDLACSVGHVKCLEEAGALFKAWINDEKDNRPHPDIRALIYYYGMSHSGTESDWNIMFERYTNETDADEKNILMDGLAGIRSIDVLEKYINLAIDEQDLGTLKRLSSISRNPEGRKLVWDWVRKNQPLLVERYDVDDLDYWLISRITEEFSTKVQLDEIQAFFSNSSEAGAIAMYGAQTIETIVSNKNWVEKNELQISNWLDSRPAPKHIS